MVPLVVDNPGRRAPFGYTRCGSQRGRPAAARPAIPRSGAGPVPLEHLGPVIGREPRVAEHLVAELVDDREVAVRLLDEVPPLGGPAVEVALLDEGPLLFEYGLKSALPLDALTR